MISFTMSISMTFTSTACSTASLAEFSFRSSISIVETVCSRATRQLSISVILQSKSENVKDKKEASLLSINICTILLTCHESDYYFDVCPSELEFLIHYELNDLHDESEPKRFI